MLIFKEQLKINWISELQISRSIKASHNRKIMPNTIKNIFKNFLGS